MAVDCDKRTRGNGSVSMDPRIPHRSCSYESTGNSDSESDETTEFPPRRSIQNADLSIFCDQLSQTVGSAENFRKIITERCGHNEFVGVGKSDLIIHPGFRGTLESIKWEFEMVYTGKKLYMVGYLDELGSDTFIMLDDDGKVYKADDSLLYLVGDNFCNYLKNGPNTEESFYDYYGHRDQTKSLPCAGFGTYDDELAYLDELGKTDTYCAGKNSGADNVGSFLEVKREVLNQECEEMADLFGRKFTS
ncbi:uncharacterized protein LOC144453290 [Glandiceps talaboti]